jgi:hypothetical protein
VNIKFVSTGVEKLVSENATTLLTAGGVVGTMLTGVLAARAGMKASDTLRKAQAQQVPELSKTEKAVKVWPHFIPPVIIGGCTIASIIGSHHMSAKRAAALAAALGVSQKQFEEYKTKAQEKLGVAKSEKVRDELAKDQIEKTPGASQVIVLEGKVLCLDSLTGRYFESTMDQIKRAANQVNEEILKCDAASADMFYNFLGLDSTSLTQLVGWQVGHMCELDLSTQVADNDRPCIVVDFVNKPRLDFQGDISKYA